MTRRSCVKQATYILESYMLTAFMGDRYQLLSIRQPSKTKITYRGCMSVASSCHEFNHKVLLMFCTVQQTNITFSFQKAHAVHSVQ